MFQPSLRAFPAAAAVVAVTTAAVAATRLTGSRSLGDGSCCSLSLLLLSLPLLSLCALSQRRHLILSFSSRHLHQKETFTRTNWMESHVETPKPLKKRDVRPFLPLIADSDVAALTLSQEAAASSLPATQACEEGAHLPPRQVQQQVACISLSPPSRRSSDSGIVSPTRLLTEPSDSESTQPAREQPLADAAVKPATSKSASSKQPEQQEGVAKRTPFCGRCRNHWPDKPVLVKGTAPVALSSLL